MHLEPFCLHWSPSLCLFENKAEPQHRFLPNSENVSYNHAGMLGDVVNLAKPHRCTVGETEAKELSQQRGDSVGSQHCPARILRSCYSDTPPTPYQRQQLVCAWGIRNTFAYI